MATSDQEDPWFIAEGEEDDLPIIFRVREMRPPGVEPRRYPNLISILWAFDKSESGMPDDETVERMNEFEDCLDALEGPNRGFMMVTITGNGRREWLWYVADTSEFMSGVNRVLASLSAKFPVSFEGAQDPSWQTFRAFVDRGRSS